MRQLQWIMPPIFFFDSGPKNVFFSKSGPKNRFSFCFWAKKSILFDSGPKNQLCFSILESKIDFWCKNSILFPKNFQFFDFLDPLPYTHTGDLSSTLRMVDRAAGGGRGPRVGITIKFPTPPPPNPLPPYRVLPPHRR